MNKILGIDPGSRVMGFGIISQQSPSRYQHHASGCIRVTHQSPMSARLLAIYEALDALMEEHAPDTVVIEEVFMKHAEAALKLGQARGVAIVVAAKHGIPIEEYSPRQIKQAVVGYGGADKKQVQRMIKALLRLDSLPAEDQADALAVAICHAHSATWEKKLAGVST